MKADQELFGQLQVQSITNPIAYIQKILENWMKNGVIMTEILQLSHQCKNGTKKGP